MTIEEINSNWNQIMTKQKIIKYLHVIAGIIIVSILPISLIFIWFSNELSTEIIAKTLISIVIVLIFIYIFISALIDRS